MSVLCPQSCFTSLHDFVMVCEFVDGAVKHDPACNFFAELFSKISALYKIAYEIPDHDFGIVAGEI